MAHHAVGQHRIGRQRHGAPVAVAHGGKARQGAEIGDVGRREDEPRPRHRQRRRSVTKREGGASVGRADHDGMERAGRLDVGRILAPAGDELGILDPLHRLAQPEFHRLHRGVPSSVYDDRLRASARRVLRYYHARLGMPPVRRAHRPASGKRDRRGLAVSAPSLTSSWTSTDKVPAGGRRRLVRQPAKRLGRRHVLRPETSPAAAPIG